MQDIFAEEVSSGTPLVLVHGFFKLIKHVRPTSRFL